jgi:hypothetical protein
MEDASAITSLPDDPQALKQIILNLSRERDDWHVKFLRVETELLRLKKMVLRPAGRPAPDPWRRGPDAAGFRHRFGMHGR